MNIMHILKKSDICVPGLGTSTSKEAKEYFADMEKHRIMFRYSGAEDDAAITLVSSILTLRLYYSEKLLFNLMQSNQT